MLANRVREYTVTTGTGDIALGGALPAHITFADAFSAGDSVNYVVEDGDNYEIGTGTLVDATTLERTTVGETLVGGIYTKVDAEPMSLSGNARVFCAATAEFLLDPIIPADVIREVTDGAGVTIDGVLLKDGGVNVTGAINFNTDAAVKASFNRGGKGWEIIQTSDGSNLRIRTDAGTDILAFNDSINSATFAGDVSFVGDISVASGSAASPSYSFTARDDTGMYLNGVDQIGLAAGGGGRVLISPTAASFFVPMLMNTRSITGIGKLEVDGGSKISVQNQVDGGSEHGIFLWDTNNSNYGIYTATSGIGKSIAGDTACTSLDGRTAWHVRNRVGAGETQGFIWENHFNQCLMSLTSDTGDLYTKGGVVAQDRVKLSSTSSKGRIDLSNGFTSISGGGGVPFITASGASANDFNLEFGLNGLAHLSINNAGDVLAANDLAVGASSINTSAKLHVSYGNTISNPIANKGIVLESDVSGALNIITPNTNIGYINFGDPEDSNDGRIFYSHPNRRLSFEAGTTRVLDLDSDGSASFSGDFDARDGFFRNSAGGRIVLDDSSGAHSSFTMKYITASGNGLIIGTAQRNPSTGNTTNSTPLLIFDAAGSANFQGNDLVGLGNLRAFGTFLENWNSNYGAFQYGNIHSDMFSRTQVDRWALTNAYFGTDSVWRRQTSGEATTVNQTTSLFSVKYAPTGAGESTIAWENQFTIDGAVGSVEFHSNDITGVGDLGVTGDVILTSGLIRNTANTSSTVIAGGITAAQGAGATFYGLAHPTFANDTFFTAAGSTWLQYDHSADTADFHSNNVSRVGRLGVGGPALSSGPLVNLVAAADNGHMVSFDRTAAAAVDNIFTLVVSGEGSTATDFIELGPGLRVFGTGDVRAQNNLTVRGDLFVEDVANFGTTTGVTGNSGLWIKDGADVSLVVGSDNAGASLTNSTAKTGRIGAPHYLNAEEPMSIVTAFSDATNNTLAFGGGTVRKNAATAINFYTAANTTTTFGALALSIDKHGNANFQGNSVGGVDVLTLSNEVRVPNGVAADPSYTFSSEDGTGIYLPAINELSFAVGGNRQLFLSSTQADFQGNSVVGMSDLQVSAAGNAANVTIQRSNAGSANSGIGTIQFENNVGTVMSRMNSMNGTTTSRGALGFWTRYDADLLQAIEINENQNTDFLGNNVTGVSDLDAEHIELQGDSGVPTLWLRGSSRDIAVPEGEFLQIGSWNSGSSTWAEWLNIGVTGATFNGDLSVAGKFNLGASTELIITAGTVTVTKSFHIIDTENDDPADNLQNITGGTEGDILTISIADDIRPITVKHNDSGNIRCGIDFTMTSVHDTMQLMFRSGLWVEVSRSSNG